MNRTGKNRRVLGVNRLPAKYYFLVMPFILSILMTCIVSFISTAKVRGMGGDFFYVWTSAWFFSWIVAYPTLLLVLPIVKKMALFVVECPSRPVVNLDSSLNDFPEGQK